MYLIPGSYSSQNLVEKNQIVQQRLLGHEATVS